MRVFSFLEPLGKGKLHETGTGEERLDHPPRKHVVVVSNLIHETSDRIFTQLCRPVLPTRVPLNKSVYVHKFFVLLGVNRSRDTNFDRVGAVRHPQSIDVENAVFFAFDLVDVGGVDRELFCCYLGLLSLTRLE